MSKIKPTFDQLYRSFYLNKLLELGLEENKDFKIVNDSSQFQHDDQLKDFAIVMIKSYGGTKSSLRGLDATNLKMQVLVNTDQPQKWKMYIDEITEAVNGDYETIVFPETEKYEETTYSFFQTLNTSNVISNAQQVSTSSRHIVQTSGNIFYTSARLDLGVDFYVFIDTEYVKATRLITTNFNYISESESINSKDSDIFKSIDKGHIRQFQFTFILDDTNPVHQLLLNKFLDGDTDELDIKLDIDNLEVEKEYTTLISNLRITGQIGQNGSIELTLIESGF